MLGNILKTITKEIIKAPVNIVRGVVEAIDDTIEGK